MMELLVWNCWYHVSIRNFPTLTSEPDGASCCTLPHLHRLYLLVAAVPGEESAVLPSRHQRAVPQHAQSKDATLVSSLDDVADAISACVCGVAETDEMDERVHPVRRKGRVLCRGRIIEQTARSMRSPDTKKTRFL